jgi:short-subunit dehydrogenase
MAGREPPRAILITGASSGIGAALARHYARPGVRLFLSGRDAARLAEEAARCMAQGAAVEQRIIDTTAREAMAAWLAACDEAAPLDLVIANAGISGGTRDSVEDEAQVRQIFAANVEGVFNTVLPLVPRMVARRRGQIALMSSIAAFRGFPGAPAYAASKAAVRVWGEGLRGDLKAYGVGVSVICPGFVVSRMTATNRYPMPFLMSAERAAAIITRGLARNRGRIAFPWPTYALAWLLGAVPPSWFDPLLTRLPRKG